MLSTPDLKSDPSYPVVNSNLLKPYIKRKLCLVEDICNKLFAVNAEMTKNSLILEEFAALSRGDANEVIKSRLACLVTTTIITVAV